MKRLLVLLGLATASAPAQPPAPAAPPPLVVVRMPVDYAEAASWLCLPGREDSCGQPLPTTALNPNGYGSTGRAVPTADPPIDCFYVYPTVSRDAGLNSDMEVGIEERGTVAVQFARFAGICRPFAPIYRSATVRSIAAMLTGENPLPVLDWAYRDVLAAWRQYLANRNNGRPFVLIGHSQGTIHLSRLLAEEIEGRPEAARMLSALLLGFNVEVPVGQVAGGTFRATPLCTRTGQTGCVITYVSFRAEAPPPPGAIFGRAAAPGRTVGCTNPAALGSSASAPLDSYWYALSSTVLRQDIAWSSEGPPPTPFLRTEGLVSAACVNDGPVGYLAVTVNADPVDARTDEIPGDVRLGGIPAPGWGLHLVDVNLALGDLIRAVEAQRDAFPRQQSRP